MKKIYTLIPLLILIVTETSRAQETGAFTDARDGKTYKTVKIGSQTWMAENLNANRFKNGDVIPEVKGWLAWRQMGAAHGKDLAAWCYYDNSPEKGKVFGKLYNWFAVVDPRGLAPSGWHIPTLAEWKILTHFLGDAVAGRKMTFDELSPFYPNGWATNKNSDNESGFTAIPGGNRDSYKEFGGVGFECFLWSSQEYSNSGAYELHLVGADTANLLYDDKGKGLSVRCVKD